MYNEDVECSIGENVVIFLLYCCYIIIISIVEVIRRCYRGGKLQNSGIQGCE